MTRFVARTRMISTAFFACLLIASQAGAESLGKVMTVKHLTEGAVETRTLKTSEGAALSLVQLDAEEPRMQIQDPGQSVRLLVRLKDQPLKPYLQEFSASHASDAKSAPASYQKQYAKAAQSHQQRLQKGHAQVLSEMRRKKVLDTVHHQFFTLTNTLAITTAASNIDEIRKLPQVAEVYPDNEVTALLGSSLAVVGTGTVWELRDNQNRVVTGQGITVAILDSGIDYKHPDLGGCLGSDCKVVGGFNFIEGEDFSDPMDVHGHGTHVAGIVAANGTLKGVAPNAKLYAFKVLNDFGYGTDSAIIAGLERAADLDGDPLTHDPVDIINMSLGGWGEAGSPLSEAANAAMDAGIVVVVAAGNAGGYATIGSPGNAAQVITVGATDNADSIAPFSSRGPVWGQGYVKPELVAPGVDINSAAPGGGYAIHSGTSMAAPHVTGGVALLKQLYPESSAQEIKSLLVANTQNIGEDIFTQGAGRMNLVAAANANIVISPALISFGNVNIALPHWKSEIPLRMKNISSEARSFSLGNPGSLPAGMTLNLSQADTINLAPGEIKDLRVSVDVDTAALPFPDSSSMHHESSFEVISGPTAFRIPFALIKSAQLKLDVSERLYGATVLADDGSYAKFNFYPCDDGRVSPNFPVKPGRYHVMFWFAGDDTCSLPNIFVFKENIQVDSVVSVSATQSEAIHDVSIAGLIDDTGALLDADKMEVKALVFDWYHAGASYWTSSSMYFGSLSLAKFSEVSDNIKLGLSAVVERKNRPKEDRTFYLVEKIYVDGVHEGKQFILDHRNQGKVTFEYRDQQVLTEGVILAYGDMQTSSFAENILTGGLTYDHVPYYEPFKVTYYSELATFDLQERYPAIALQKYDESDSWGTILLETGPILFPDADSYAKVKGPFFYRNTISYESESNAMLIEQSPHFLSARAFYEKAAERIYLFGHVYRFGQYGLQKDVMHNMFNDEMPYSVTCDGKLIDEGRAQTTSFSVDMSENGQCERVALEFIMPTRFFGFNDSTVIQYILNPASSIFADYYAVESPMIEQVTFFNDGKQSRILAGEKAWVSVDISDKTFQSELNYDLDVAIEYRLDSDTEWRSLAVVKTGESYRANIPVVVGSHVGSLRVTAKNDFGNSVIQTLNSTFLLGNNSSSLTRVPPEFEALPRLTVEATASLTPFVPPLVIAADTVDGAITATTETEGPFAIGTHHIIWNATNSAGMGAFATQELVITDTTPPVVTAPVSINIQATGAQTAVTLGTATANDLVDGALVATSDNSGPFAVGAHVINWRAQDTSGNIGTAVQLVTVTAMSPAPTPSPTPAPTPAPSSTKSGGGAVSLWALAALLFIGWINGVFKGFQRHKRRSFITSIAKLEF